ncbi:hypothetical protein C6501_14255 [Candidatus Poribacteria bacterium]|nr:MAG: hypothetical protein C6501_14255 [Candidatus Poribacteria bacterium]
MGTNVLTLPVSLEQVAALIKRMRPQDRQQLLAMVPELVADAVKQKELLEDANQNVEELRQELLEELGGQPLSPNEPFLNGLTLGQYLELPEEERAKLWDQWSKVAIEELDELEVRPDAMSAG